MTIDKILKISENLAEMHHQLRNLENFITTEYIGSRLDCTSYIMHQDQKSISYAMIVADDSR